MPVIVSFPKESEEETPKSNHNWCAFTIILAFFAVLQSEQVVETVAPYGE